MLNSARATGQWPVSFDGDQKVWPVISKKVDKSAFRVFLYQVLAIDSKNCKKLVNFLLFLARI